MKKREISKVTFIPSKTNVEMQLEFTDTDSVAIDLSISDAKELAENILLATQYADLPENKE